uniref:Uncharacterized protein n=1 Tax=Heterorhabditis bacteriophora TaxID=37862 RepID=A0A1I7XV75_HETBA
MFQSTWTGGLEVSEDLSSGFKSPSKATHYEWLDTTRATFRIGKTSRPSALKHPVGVVDCDLSRD